MQQDPKKVLNRLWGDHFWDPETKKFYTNNISPSGKPLERFVCKMVLGPIFKLSRALMDNDWVTADKLLTVFDVTLKAEDRQLLGKDLFRRVMSKFLPLADALKEIIIDHIPSPAVAQKYRAEILYTGPIDHPVRIVIAVVFMQLYCFCWAFSYNFMQNAIGIRDCNPDGPLVVFISKMAPASGKGFYAFGRVFSGTLKPGMKAYILDPLAPSKAKEKNIPGVLVMMGKSAQRMECVPCGNTVAIMGIDDLLVKSGTLLSDPNGHPIRPMKFSVSAVVRVAITPKHAADLPKFIAALKYVYHQQHRNNCNNYNHHAQLFTFYNALLTFATEPS